MFGSRFSIFGSAASERPDITPKSEVVPSLKLRTDKDVYRPGDSIVVTIEICNAVEPTRCSLLIERLGFEIKGIRKLDMQWFASQKPLLGSRQRRGEHVILDCSVPSILTNEIVSSGCTKSYLVRTMLPSTIPPSYKGATIRYTYFVKTTLSGRWLMLENGHSYKESVKDLVETEARVPLQVWVTQKTSSLLMEEGQSNGITRTTSQMDIFFKEMDGDSDWAKANDIYDGIDEGYESSRDEVLSVSSYNPMKEQLQRNFGSSLSLQSSAARSSIKDGVLIGGERTSFASNIPFSQLTVAEVLYDSGADVSSPKIPSAIVSPSQSLKLGKRLSTDEDAGVPSSPGMRAVEPVTSEGFVRGRSYNIRLDDEVLLKFSPRNSDSTYFFSDTIGGTLTFFHEEGARRCLEVSITLETSETVSQHFVHPSRRNSPTITKIQSDHYEVVADMVQTSFLFSIPMDGPMTFSTPHVSIKWALRFEFFTTPKNLDWTRYEHPLLIERREKTEWVLPITVHAPPVGLSRKETPFSLEPSWAQS